MDLPQRASQHVISEEAVTILKSVLPREWVVRDQPASDYGIDIEIELAADKVSGAIFKGQVKGHLELDWRVDGTCFQQVRPQTVNYWRRFRVPVLLFVVDVRHRQVYWSETQTLVDTVPAAPGIAVPRANALPSTSTKLALYVITWMDVRTARQTIYRVPLLARRIEERMNWVDADAWMAVEDDDVEEARDLYEQIVRLAQVVGLDVFDILPWDMWLARSAKFWGDGDALYFGTHAELALYMKAIFDEALGRVLKIIDLEPPSPANSHMKGFFESKQGGYQVSWRFDNRFKDLDGNAWQEVETRLEQRGALRYQVNQIRQRAPESQS